jgi:arylsulfatase A-like enzyme
MSVHVRRYLTPSARSVDLMNARAEVLVIGHDVEMPLFLYYAIPLVHEPLQVPDRILVSKAVALQNIPNAGRRTFAAMTVLLDESVAMLVGNLRASGLYDSTLIVIASDNGGHPSATSSGSNLPFRGEKGQLWEGGVRTHAVIHSPLIPAKARGSMFDGKFHVSDWVPTLIGGFLNRFDAIANAELDGIDQWPALIGDEAPLRNEVLLNIDGDDAAIIIGDFKLNVHTQMPPFYKVSLTDEPDMDEQDMSPLSSFLFNLADDPTEDNNLFDMLPGTVEQMTGRLSELSATQVPLAYCEGTYEVREFAVESFQLTQAWAPWLETSEYECST